jgi:multidrug transporter EmrE-like cation transporter
VTAALAGGLGVAVLAASALNVSYLMQHVGSASAPRITARHPVRTLRGLLRSRLWIAGLAFGLTGWGLHIGALSLAPLSLVQSFGAAGLVLAALASVRVLGERLSSAERAGICLLVVALASLSLGARATPSAGPSVAMFGFLAIAAAVAAAVVGLGGHARRPYMLGAAGGVLYGAADTATKAATGVASHSGVAAAVVSPTALTIALLNIGAFFCFQRGLQSGIALPVIALMTAGTNVVAILGGVAVFGDPLGPGAGLTAAHLAAFVLVCAAGWLLAPAQARMVAGAPTTSRAPFSLALPGASSS